jgi:protein phosphatase
MKVAVYGETNVGLHRDHNEDAFLMLCDVDKKWQEVNNLQIDLTPSKGMFLVVADGMGGANAGEVASSIAVNKVGEKVRTLNSALIDEHHVQRYLWKKRPK